MWKKLVSRKLELARRSPPPKWLWWVSFVGCLAIVICGTVLVVVMPNVVAKVVYAFFVGVNTTMVPVLWVTRKPRTLLTPKQQEQITQAVTDTVEAVMKRLQERGYPIEKTPDNTWTIPHAGGRTLQ